jgi:hypothetical protein
MHVYVYVCTYVYTQITIVVLGTVVYTCNPSIQEAEAEESRVQSQPGLQSKTLSKKKKEGKQKN